MYAIKIKSADVVLYLGRGGAVVEEVEHAARFDSVAAANAFVERIVSERRFTTNYKVLTGNASERHVNFAFTVTQV